MDKSTELINTTELVKSILMHNSKARNDDNFLYYLVCKEVGSRNDIDIESMSMPRFFLNLRFFGFPAFETVRRSRQKLQATYPELAGHQRVESKRTQYEGAFRDYARGHV